MFNSYLYWFFIHDATQPEALCEFCCTIFSCTDGSALNLRWSRLSLLNVFKAWCKENYAEWNFLSILRLQWIHVSKRGHCQMSSVILVNTGPRMAYCLTAPSLYVNQCWLSINQILWRSLQCKLDYDTRYMNPIINLYKMFSIQYVSRNITQLLAMWLYHINW